MLLENEVESLLSHKRKKQISKRAKIKKTLVLCYAYIMLGLLISVLGPSLLLLAQLLHRKIDDVGYIFTVRGIGYMVTVLIVGIILDKFSVSSSTAVPIPKNKFLRYLMYRLNAILFIISIMVMGLGMIAMPFIENYSVMLTLNVLTGIAGGCIDCVASVVMIWTWGESANTYMQGLHAAYGIGAFLGPFYLQIVENILKNLGLQLPWYINALSVTYVSIGLCMLTSLVLFFFIPFIDVKRKKIKQITVINVEDEVPIKKSCWDVKQIIVGSLTSISLFLYCGVEGGYSGYISSYVILYDREHFHSSSSLIASIFWLSFTIGRLLAMPISQFLSIGQVLISNSVFCCSSLLVMALTKNYIALWVTCVSLGFFMASQYPTTFSTPSSHLNIQLSAIMTSMMVIMANLGSTIYQTILAIFLPQIFWILMGSIGGKLLIDFVLLYGIKKRTSEN